MEGLSFSISSTITEKSKKPEIVTVKKVGVLILSLVVSWFTYG
jgi:hypothetical protein